MLADRARAIIIAACLLFAAASNVLRSAQAEPRACIGIGDKAASQPLRLAGFRPVLYERAAGRALLLHVLPARNAPPGRPAPAILLFFGGGWLHGSIHQFEPQAQALADRGMTAILVDYRVLCRDGVDPRAGMKDAAAAMRFVRAHADELSIDPRRIAAGGGSAGGQLALSTAFDADPAVPTHWYCSTRSSILPMAIWPRTSRTWRRPISGPSRRSATRPPRIRQC